MTEGQDHREVKVLLSGKLSLQPEPQPSFHDKAKRFLRELQYNKVFLICSGIVGLGAVAALFYYVDFYFGIYGGGWLIYLITLASKEQNQANKILGMCVSDIILFGMLGLGALLLIGHFLGILP